jgi:hypothetical protein
MANNTKEKLSMHCGIILSENGREIKAWQRRMVAIISVSGHGHQNITWLIHLLETSLT